MSTYRAFEVTGQRDFRWVEREVRDPEPGEVRIRVEACGVCHTDAFAAEGMRADPSKPVVPGHEIVGVIEAVGGGVHAWHVGERVGVGYLNGHCGQCEQCRRGDFVNCANQNQTGTTVDGGYSEVAYAQASGLVRVPEGVDPLDAAPLLCAGLTVYRALLTANARPGSLIAIQGIGGLGHLGIQYAKSLGYRVVAIARGTGKEDLARQLGADEYIDSTAGDPSKALRALGGATAVLATASSGSSMSPLVAGLAPNGKLIVVGADSEPIEVSIPDLIFGTRSIVGSLTGSAIENEDNLNLAQHQGIRSMNEIMPLSDAPKAYERMMAGAARFRVVLDAKA
ncbi:alcohol dehydrogenase catalytic domain-containing protein [Mycobacterium sp. CBMA271]|uniref:alcohol dehydrogenase catalytic domain-containing protein n=1 Tax=unclassified Mycobacteroides TaxID=2618759 RepID=UPI00132571BE|nr:MULTISPECIES: alcohol dehydrogenase catalytic domain-containing protein [unclassified Mycobacteroides]MUM19274.1 alcohol dehydrogenase [Mycobacteroides sp. CBMA 326]MUM21687.1 alcohol dehydrogenase catalytic domain-containing protein [Mycobacteroides sp. CBMA 271]